MEKRIISCPVPVEPKMYVGTWPEVGQQIVDEYFTCEERRADKAYWDTMASRVTNSGGLSDLVKSLHTSFYHEEFEEKLGIASMTLHELCTSKGYAGSMG